MRQAAISPGSTAATFAERLAGAIDSRRVSDCIRDVLEGEGRGRVRFVDCELERLHFGGGIGPVAEYAMILDDGGRHQRRRMFVQVPRDEPGDAFHTARTKVHRRLAEAGQTAGADQRLIYLEEIGAILRPEGLDERVDGLWLLGEGAGLPEFFASGGRSISGWNEFEVAARQGLGSRLLAHRLGKRAVLELYAGGENGGALPSVIAKFYKRSTRKLSALADRYILLTHGVFAGRGDVRVPRLLTVFNAHRGIVTDRAPGQPLGDMEGAEAARAYRLGGKALACLHRAGLDAPFCGPVDEQDMLGGIVSKVLAVDPTYARDFKRALMAVARQREHYQPFEPRLIHRDFHEKQVISDGECACLIDFDMVAKGDPAQDVANFVAHLWLRELQTNEDMSLNISVFVDGYASEGLRCTRENLDFHLSATFTRLASILLFSDRWRHLVPTLLEQAGDGPIPAADILLGPLMTTIQARSHEV